MNFHSFFAELKRRNVYRVAVAYAIVAWLLIQIATQVFPFLEIPNWAIRLVIMLLALGFPVALILAWAFELTPEGIKRSDETEPGQRSKSRAWIYIVIIAGALSLGLFFLGRYSASTQKSGSVELPAKSIAVLPFESLSEDKSNAYFADGIQDEILARLSKIGDLKVISRTSTQKYKSVAANLRDIAQQLGVAHILEGSVQKVNDQVRVTVQLITAASDEHLWSETYDRKLIDVFQVESDVAQKIASSLEAKLTGREKAEINTRGTSNPQAYDNYLHALSLLNRQGEQDLEQLLVYGLRAVELDPGYADAWALLANAEAQKYSDAEHYTESQLARARTTAETALRLAPDSTEGHGAMGFFYYYCLKDFDHALAEFTVAHERAPNDANLALAVGLAKRRQGKVEESIAIGLQAVKLDPLNQDIWANIARSYRGVRKFAEARAMIDRALAIEPDQSDLIFQKAETYFAQGEVGTGWDMIKSLKVPPPGRGLWLYNAALILQRRYDDVIAAMSSTLANEKNISPLFAAFARADIAYIYFLKGDRAAAQPRFLQAETEFKNLQAQGNDSRLLRALLLETEALLRHGEEVEKLAAAHLQIAKVDAWEFPGAEEEVARAYAHLNQPDKAIPLLEHAISAPALEGLTAAYLRLDPVWDAIRNDPRFQKLADSKP